MKHNLNVILSLLLTIFMQSCKSDFLDAKPDKSLTVPRTLADLQSLLDNSDNVMNETPYLGLVSSDDVYISDLGLVPMRAPVPAAYKWEKEFYSGLVDYSTDWITCYKQVFYSNIVLEAVDNLTENHAKSSLDNVKGTAYFFRAYAFFQVAQQFCETYDRTNASETLGIPLRLVPDVDIPSVRSSLEQTYTQIVLDLEHSLRLLPEMQIKLTRPTKIAACALLARVYLVMGDYENAERYASQVLAKQSTLLNYNQFDPNSTRPFPTVLQEGYNPEVLFYSVMGTIPGFQISSEAGVDTALYHAYDDHDLRKGLFFRKRSQTVFSFKGQYSGAGVYFTGLAVDEIYLIRAECRARMGDFQGALSDINKLLVTRWKAGRYVPFSFLDRDQLLSQILNERRKQLVFRGLRWSDLRRLNKDEKTGMSLFRRVQGELIELRPNDPKYVFALPPDVIKYSNMEQNPR